MQKVVIMAGGTGGHVFPGLAIANALQQKDIKVSWLGTPFGIEAKLVPEHHIPFNTIDIKGLRGKNWREQLLIPWRLVKSIHVAYRLFKQEKPDVVLGMGGYVAGPGGIAAKLAGIPLVIHEQNSIAGLTNKLLAKIATKVMCAFPNTFSNSNKFIVTGNPVRKEIEAINKQPDGSHKPRLLIIGGSLGAHIFNEILPKAMALLSPEERPEIWHQTGKKDYEATVLAYKTHHIAAKVEPFIDDIARAYTWADLLLSRAGALTIAELTTVGLAAILVPYPHAVDDHQTMNARYVVNAGGAILIAQKDFTAETLSVHLKKLFENKERLAAMAHASRTLREEHVIEKMITVITSL